MSAEGKPLRVIAAFGYYSVGDVIYPTGMYREQLIQQKLCEAVQRDEGEGVECATVAPAECAATRMAPKGRRRRRRQEREAKGVQVETQGG